MYIVVFSSLACLFLTYLDSIGVFKKGLSVSFIILTILAAIHYDYGNDYMVYYDLYGSLTNSSFNYKAVINGEYKDYGWTFLCYLFKPVGGFFTMVAVLSVIQNLLVFRFIKNVVNRFWWPVAIFIYLFMTKFYLLNFSMLRQGLVVCIFLGLWTYIRDKKWWIPLIVLMLCSTIHASSKILIPFSFWGFLSAKKSKLIVFVYAILFLLLFLSSNFLNFMLEKAMLFETFEEYGDIYVDMESTVTFGLGYIVGIIPFMLSGYYLLKTKDNSANKQIVMLAMLSFLIAPFTSKIPLISRVAFYFGIYQMAAIPLVFKSIKRQSVRIIIMLPWIILQIYAYWRFFNYGVFAEPYRNFHTIFEVI